MLSISVNFGNFVANERIFSYGLEKIKKKINSPRDLISMLSLSISMELLKFRCQRKYFSRNISFVRTRKNKEKDKFSRFNFDAFPFDLDFGNFVANARLSSIFLGIYRSTEKIKKKINSPRNLISMLFLSISILEISLPTRGFRFFNFFLGIYRSYGFEKLKKKVNSPRDLISMLSLSISILEISLPTRGFRVFF